MQLPIMQMYFRLVWKLIDVLRALNELKVFQRELEIGSQGGKLTSPFGEASLEIYRRLKYQIACQMIWYKKEIFLMYCPSVLPNDPKHVFALI